MMAMDEKSREILQRFADQFRSGAQGAHFEEAEDAQALAFAIDAALSSAQPVPKELLAPFIEVANSYSDREDDSFKPWIDAPPLTLGDFRKLRAYAALLPTAPQPVERPREPVAPLAIGQRVRTKDEGDTGTVIQIRYLIELGEPGSQDTLDCDGGNLEPLATPPLPGEPLR